MKIESVSLADCRAIASRLGIRFEGDDISNSRGIRTTGTLRADSATNPYPRISSSGKRMPHCVCWHGHRDFIRAVFAVNPSARIQTGLRGAIDYRGSESFEDSYLETGFLNVGSLFAPMSMAEACSCKEAGEVA